MLVKRKILWLLLCCLTLPALSQARDINAELLDAARAGRTDEVRDLLAEGADVNTANTAGKTVLMMAAAFGNARIVDILLAEGADVNAKDKSQSTALIAAAYNGNLHVVKSLLARGADVNVKSKNGVTAMSTATTVGHEAVAKYLETVAQSGGTDGDSDKKKSKFGSKSKKGK
jgi:ankyrin repeat protein